MQDTLLSYLRDEENWLLVYSLAIYALAVMSAIRAILVTRTAQGAMGWVIALLAMPIVVLPIYWVFGRSKFHGYVSRRAMVTARARRATRPLDTLRSYEE